jgi:hypothetical protein
MTKMILEKGTPLPLPIEYSDIDTAMYEWVDKKINLVYDGKRLPTYKLYSTQRLSEYIQTWDNTDDTNSLTLNFKTVTREFNPQKGEIQGNYFNIPGHRDYAVFYVPVLEENGTEAYDKYTMKQPFGVNLTYSVSIVTNKMDILNEMNEIMLYEFSAINCYISPNNHPMSMTLEEISDDSEYSIDDRKYYSQTYKIKVRGYIIRKEDYQVERLPSRVVISSNDSNTVGKVNKRGKHRKRDERVEFMSTNPFKLDIVEDGCDVFIPNDATRPIEVSDDSERGDSCCEEEEKRFTYKKVKVIVKFNGCTSDITFEIDKEIVLDSIELDNVYDFKVFINDELINLDNEVKIVNGDIIRVRISKDNAYEDGILSLVGYDPNESVDNKYIAESALDEQSVEEDIYVEAKEDEE